MEYFLGTQQNVSSLDKNISLTEKIFGLNWSEYFPLELGNPGEFIQIADLKTSSDFFKKNYESIYQKNIWNSPFLSSGSSITKEKYYETAGDFFAFMDGNKVTGIFVGTLVDWSTYYFRNCSILPEYQGGGRYQKLLKHLLMILKKHSVERVEGDIAPSNLGHIHVLNKLGFNITGLNLSERWGSLVHFTKYLNPTHESVFLDQFCEGVRPQIKV